MKNVLILSGSPRRGGNSDLLCDTSGTGAAQAGHTDTVMNCTLKCFRGFATCLNGSVEKGVLYGKGVYEAGNVKSTVYMQQAYAMGKGV